MATDSDATAYRVLARKYRPSNFAELVGQDALVRTLSNAIESGRLAQAYMLTGVRGVGKTTTARIIARALNCTGEDGTGGITVSPCGKCDNCIAIAEDRHVDVMEMDAASRTGVDDIRELIEGVRYKPVSARYKVYIIDEVHMLSKNAFNALLKTLEEPPEHVRFVFATTEIRKVPVTVLSRCQRFDLRRLDVEELSKHFTDIAGQEKIEIEPEAIRIISRAADGSVRDGLSLLDQAIALGSDKVTAAQVQEMLGLADRGAVFDLFDRLMSGEIKEALDQMQAMYRDGAEPAAVLQDLLDVTYWMTRIKVAPEIAESPGTPEIERTRGPVMAEKLSMPVLTRTWQMLLKGLEETLRADAQLQAAEMVLVRLAYAADLPSPGDLARELAAKPQQPAAPASSPGMGGNGSGGGGSAHPSAGAPAAAIADPIPVEAASAPPPSKSPRSFLEVLQLFETNREIGIRTQLYNSVHLVKFEPGRIEMRLTDHAPGDLVQKTMRFLRQWTGEQWFVTVSQAQGEPTLAEQDAVAKQKLLDAAELLPVVQAVKESFPGAIVRKVTPRKEYSDPDSEPDFLEAPEDPEDEDDERI